MLHREGLLDQNLKYLTCVQHVGTVLLSVVREILKYSLLITVGKGTRMSRIDIIRDLESSWLLLAVLKVP